MVRGTTVWMVHLRRDPLRDIEGTLGIEAGKLVFTAGDGYSHERIDLRTVQRVQRVLGSPVLVVHHVEGGEPARTAFYFAQPPPLDPTSGSRATTRKTRRQGVAYLGRRNRELRGIVQDWLDRIRGGVEAARERPA